MHGVEGNGEAISRQIPQDLLAAIHPGSDLSPASTACEVMLLHLPNDMHLA